MTLKRRLPETCSLLSHAILYSGQEGIYRDFFEVVDVKGSPEPGGSHNGVSEARTLVP